ncbi:UvrD-helicase domain-containing protein, partial [Candidatus Poriferisocius sp.]|uniref:UvrD-helicase domain-containing protein n=1 Tax=Candidatus Poriferisocius sp. TaxID=3101276 RepID=UPI003B51D7E9
MNFRIADTFTDSLAKLTGSEQKAIKTTAFDLQLNPANPGMQFHKLDRVKDPNFWSVRVSRDIRLIVHRSADSLLLCYVDHHDKAYQWAERRKLETHPQTGAAQLVEIRERVQEIAVPTYVVEKYPVSTKAALFDNVSENELLGFGVPAEWLNDVRKADEDKLLEIADHLPGEAAEALLELATGGRPKRATVVTGTVDPFDHPDAQRRFRVMADAEEFSLALEYPWEKWAIFLHPAQRNIVEKDFSGPARVSGSAGTGKTIVALHRAVHLARINPGARVLLTTFSDTLVSVLRIKLRRLISNEPRLAERLEVYAINRISERLFEAHIARPKIATREQIRQLLTEATDGKGAQRFSPRFLLREWEDVVDAWQLPTWEDYRDVKRLGRKTRLPEQQRLELWEVFEIVKRGLSEQGLVTRAQMCNQLAEKLPTRRNPPFDFAVVDEAQDIGVTQLRFLAALGGGRPNALFFAGDLGQRIFQPPFSWKSLGVDVRGRSQTLRINYRTSHQIRMQSDRLLGPQISDVDGNVEDRRGTVSIFNGPEPDIRVFNSKEQEGKAVGAWIAERIAEDVMPHEIGIFVRSMEQLDRAKAAAQESGTPFKTLDEHMEISTGMLSVSTMHLAKGLEFRAVVAMACDDEVIPLLERIESVADDADLQETYDTERHLL